MPVSSDFTKMIERGLSQCRLSWGSGARHGLYFDTAHRSGWSSPGDEPDYLQGVGRTVGLKTADLARRSERSTLSPAYAGGLDDMTSKCAGDQRAEKWPITHGKAGRSGMRTGGAYLGRSRCVGGMHLHSSISIRWENTARLRKTLDDARVVRSVAHSDY